MSEDGEKGQEKEPKSSSRPTTAAARRERRSSARPSGKAGSAKPDTKRGATAARTDKDRKPAAKDAKGVATPKRDRKEASVSPVKRLVRFVREVWAELRKVIWPTRKQMVTYTTVVLVFVAFMVALVGVLDLAFAKGVFWLFG